MMVIRKRTVHYSLTPRTDAVLSKSGAQRLGADPDYPRRTLASLHRIPNSVTLVGRLFKEGSITRVGRATKRPNRFAHTCALTEYLTAPLFQCGGTRDALSNWATRISSLEQQVFDKKTAQGVVGSSPPRSFCSKNGPTTSPLESSDANRLFANDSGST